MSDPKTKPTSVRPKDFLSKVDPPRRRAQGFELLETFERATGWQPRMWGDSIVGFGEYDYTYASGRNGTWLATGFSPRKAALSIYIMPGYQDYDAILDRLGPHKMGKSCLYITRLESIDRDILVELIQAGLRDLGQLWPLRGG